MSNRREFTDKQKLAMWERAGGRCENPACRRKIVGRLTPEYDHIIPDAVADKLKPLTIEDGQVLCSECHDRKTNEQNAGPASRGDKTEIAKTKRLIEKAAGLKKRKGRPLAGTKASGWRRRMDGTVERWGR
jgi:5-methylcytosine-specific restriction endonuclease McrA